MGKNYKIFLIIFGIFISAIVAFTLLMRLIFKDTYSELIHDGHELVEYYEENKTGINEAVDYYKSILPDGKSVYVELAEGKNLKIFPLEGKSLSVDNWDLEIGTPKADSLLAELKWTDTEIRSLRDKLEASGCYSISGTDPVVLGWLRTKTGIFSYNIFQHDLVGEQLEEFNDGCKYIYYKDNVVLEYGSDDIGTPCFPEHYRGDDIR